MQCTIWYIVHSKRVSVERWTLLGCICHEKEAVMIVLSP